VSRVSATRVPGDYQYSTGFGPVASPTATCLVLGSLPGRRSIDAGEYYAHPRNAFWRIMGELAGAGPDLAYAQRLYRLRAAGIALWDVLASSLRRGSLDAGIRPDTAAPNDFASFLAAHRRIECICFNGQAAATMFGRYVSNDPGVELSKIRLVTLPSTSPAHAAMSYDDKLARWASAIRPVAVSHSSGPVTGRP